MAESNLVNDGKFVTWEESRPYGYWGISQSRTPNAEHTVTGVTGGTANTADKPDPAAKKRVDENTAASKSGGAK